jgi:hypothetical protein
MPIVKRTETIDKIKKYYCQYISSFSGKEYKKYYYNPKIAKSFLQAHIKACAQRTCVKIKEKQNDECLFD